MTRGLDAPAAAGRAARERRSRAAAAAAGYATVAAAAALLAFFLVLPVGLILVKAFRGPEGLTLAYFRLLFANDLQTGAMLNSLLIGAAATLLCTALSLPLALVSARCEFPGKRLLTALLLTPMVMPPFVGAIGVQRFFARHGSVNQLLDRLGRGGEPIDWLGGPNAFWAVVVLEVLHLYPVLYLNLTAALANVDPSLEEMATTLGVGRWRRLKDIVWPLTRPGYLAGAVIVFIWAFTDLGTPLLTGYQDALPVRIFNMVTDMNENPAGFALVCLTIAVTVCVFLGGKLALGGRRYEMLARGHVTSAVRHLSARQALPCYLLLGGTVLLALVPHFSVVVTSLSDKWFMTVLPEHYSTQAYQQVLQSDLPLIGIKNSLIFSGVATLLDLVLGLAIAYVVVRRLVPLAGLLDGLVMVPLALPGIVLAFGYVVTYTDTPLDPMVNPVPLLIIAYAIRRLPYTVRAASAGLAQTSASLEEASASLGASRLTTLRRITVPLVGANLIAGGLLCFAYAMLDVSDSLILAMKDRFYPLTKVIYALFLEQGRGELVASALGVIGMLILTVCIGGASLALGRKMGELFRSG